VSLNVSESNAVFVLLHACNLLPKVPGRLAPTHVAVEEAVILLADAAAKRLMVSVDRADIAERLAGMRGAR
jgi:hypothetical protein